METKRVFILGVLILISSIISAQDINMSVFDEVNASELLSNPAIENKMLLVEIPNEKTESVSLTQKEIYSDEKLITSLRDQFVLYRYNSKSDKRGTFKKKYNIQIYPTYIFFDNKMNEVYRLAGDFTKETFIQAINYAITPDNNMFAWAKMIEEGETNSDIYFKYAKGLLLGGQDYEKAAADYFKHSNVDFTKETYGAEAVLLFIEDMNDPRFIIFMQNLNSVYGRDMEESYVKNRINEIVSNSLLLALALDSNISLEDTVMKTVEKFQLEEPSLISALVKIKYYSSLKKNKDEYYRAVMEYLLASAFILDEKESLEYISDIVKNCDDREILMMANTRLMDMISNNNKTEYQEILIDLSLKVHDYAEASHAYEVLVRLNEKSKTYSKESLDTLQTKIIEEQNSYKESQQKKK